jgi:hypothetical protein
MVCDAQPVASIGCGPRAPSGRRSKASTAFGTNIGARSHLIPRRRRLHWLRKAIALRRAWTINSMRRGGRSPCGLGAHDATQDGTFQLSRHGFHSAECRFGTASFERRSQHGDLAERGGEGCLQCDDLTAQLVRFVFWHLPLAPWPDPRPVRRHPATTSSILRVSRLSASMSRGIPTLPLSQTFQFPCDASSPPR